MRVSFVHTKGGVGKTTSAMMVATAAANTGRPVEVYDTDRQGSAMRWAEIAQQRDDELPFPVISLTAQQLRDLPPSDEKLQIIDTPPGEAASIQAAIDTADLIIVPTGAAPMDIDRVWPTLDAVEGHPVGVLLTVLLQLGAGAKKAPFLLCDQRYVPVLSGRLEYPANNHCIRIRVTIGKHRALPLPQ